MQSGDLPLGLAHGFDNAGFGHAAEIVVGGWRPACCRNIEFHGFGDAVGVGQRTRPPIPGFVDRVDAQRNAMSKQRVAAVRIEREERVPELGRLAWQVLGPTPVPFVDGSCNCTVVETGRLTAEEATRLVSTQ